MKRIAAYYSLGLCVASAFSGSLLRAPLPRMPVRSSNDANDAYGLNKDTIFEARS